MKSDKERVERAERGTRPRKKLDHVYSEREQSEVRGKRRGGAGGRKEFGDRKPRGDHSEKPARKSFGGRTERKPYGERSDRGRGRPAREQYGDRRSRSSEAAPPPEQQKQTGLVRLNKYIANAGVCSRREADELITSGAVKVNGEICTVLGTKVGPDDVVNFGGETLKDEKKVYLLMNKPKGFITTVDDPDERKTVMELIKDACKERIYPVGRLDRNTTGVLLFTNDGELAKRLTHPSHGARKVYHVTLDKPLTKTDMAKIADGVELEDGVIQVDQIQYVETGDRTELGIQIHSGRNRIIRRIFECFGYDVKKLDRVVFAELTKKNLSRGAWRMLNEVEINFLHKNA